MSFLDKLKNRIVEVEKAAADVIQGNYVTAEIKMHRLSICNNCEYLFRATNSCKKCGCFLPAKSALKSSACPIDKW